MSEKYGYLKSQWDKYFTEINSDLKKENDISFQSFSKKIKDSKFYYDKDSLEIEKEIMICQP